MAIGTPHVQAHARCYGGAGATPELFRLAKNPTINKTQNCWETSKSCIAYKYPCSFCHLKFKNTYLLERHQRFHKGRAEHLTCGICNAVFLRQKSLAKHLKSCPQKAPEQQPAPPQPIDLLIRVTENDYAHSTGSSCHICSWDGCQVAAVSAEELEEHFIHEHASTLYVCLLNHCGHRANNQNDLIDHFKTGHDLHDNMQCIGEGCTKTLSSKQQILQHLVDMHSSQTLPFQDGLCKWEGCSRSTPLSSYAFVSNHVKTRHIHIRKSKKKRFWCDLCPRRGSTTIRISFTCQSAFDAHCKTKGHLGKIEALNIYPSQTHLVKRA